MIDFILVILSAQTIRIAMPYLFAALGGMFSERGGVVNIGLEGILLGSAFSTVAVANATGSPWLGLLGGIAGGALIAMVHAIVTVIVKADQIISGLAINMLMFGGTKFLLKVLYGSASNSPRIGGIRMAGESSGESGWVEAFIQLAQNPLVWIGIAVVILSHWVLFKSVFGLRLRAVGEHPEAAESAGVSVEKMRIAGVVLGGAVAGLGGAWLALDQHLFSAGMSNGRGYIALAAMITGKWKPYGVVLACLLFGGAEGLQIHYQGRGGIPTELLQTLPYVLTVIALCGFIGRAQAPAADGVPYEREKAL
ncbi:ABC transporter permease [soil metagenome]